MSGTEWYVEGNAQRVDLSRVDVRRILDRMRADPVLGKILRSVEYGIGQTRSGWLDIYQVSRETGLTLDQVERVVEEIRSALAEFF